MDALTYQVGDLFDFQDSDPEFDNWQAACAHALKLSDESDEVYIGDWSPGRYAWQLELLYIMDPVPAKGRQGIWTAGEALQAALSRLW